MNSCYYNGVGDKARPGSAGTMRLEKRLNISISPLREPTKIWSFMKQKLLGTFLIMIPFIVIFYLSAQKYGYRQAAEPFLLFGGLALMVTCFVIGVGLVTDDDGGGW